MPEFLSRMPKPCVCPSGKCCTNQREKQQRRFRSGEAHVCFCCSRRAGKRKKTIFSVLWFGGVVSGTVSQGTGFCLAVQKGNPIVRSVRPGEIRVSCEPARPTVFSPKRRKSFSTGQACGTSGRVLRTLAAVACEFHKPWMMHPLCSGCQSALAVAQCEQLASKLALCGCCLRIWSKLLTSNNESEPSVDFVCTGSRLLWRDANSNIQS